jgi:hypothetical protein
MALAAWKPLAEKKCQDSYRCLYRSHLPNVQTKCVNMAQQAMASSCTLRMPTAIRAVDKIRIQPRATYLDSRFLQTSVLENSEIRHSHCQYCEEEPSNLCSRPEIQQGTISDHLEREQAVLNNNASIIISWKFIIKGSKAHSVRSPSVVLIVFLRLTIHTSLNFICATVRIRRHGWI